MVSNCNACQKYRNSNPPEPLLSHEIPKDVWEKVGTDLFECLNKLCLIVIVYTNKYFKLVQLLNAASDTAITHIRSTFARHDIPKVVFSVNVPPVQLTYVQQVFQIMGFHTEDFQSRVPSE